MNTEQVKPKPKKLNGRRLVAAEEKIRIAARKAAKQGAFAKSEEIFPMAGDVPEAVLNDPLMRALFHVWKREGGGDAHRNVAKMRARWVALTKEPA